MNKVGWIKIYRRFLEWEWYDDLNVRVVFLHLLLSANHEQGKVDGMMVKRGQRVAGRKQLSRDIGVSEQSLRTALMKLQKTGEIKMSSTSKFSVITVCNYDSYQASANTHQPAGNQQINQGINQQSTSAKPIATGAVADEENKATSKSTSKSTTIKEEKEIKKKYIKKKIFKPPTLEEVKSFFEKNGYREEVAVRCFHHYDLADWHDAQGNPVKSWKQKIHTNWFSPKNLIQEQQKRKLQL